MTEDTSKRMGFDPVPTDEGANIVLVFVSVENDEPDMIQSMIHR